MTLYVPECMKPLFAAGFVYEALCAPGSDGRQGRAPGHLDGFGMWLGETRGVTPLPLRPVNVCVCVCVRMSGEGRESFPLPACLPAWLHGLEAEPSERLWGRTLRHFAALNCTFYSSLWAQTTLVSNPKCIAPYWKQSVQSDVSRCLHHYILWKSQMKWSKVK